MKRIFKLLFILLISVFLVGCKDANKVFKTKPSVDETVYNEVDEVMSHMSLDEKIGQMFIISYNSTSYNDELSNIMSTVKPGGFMFLGYNITTYNDTLKFVKDLKGSSEIPLFITVDEEGGNVERLAYLKEDITHIPYMYDVGLKDDLELTYDVGKVIGREIGVLGFNVDFAPVIDVVTNKDNQVIGKRSFGGDYEKVAKHGVALSNGIEEYNVISCYKHFPGHGSTMEDSHVDLPIINKDRETLLNEDLYPFKYAIHNDAKMIMVGHIAVPSITGDNTPASMSKAIINDLLIDELQYKGLVITDALNMIEHRDYSSDEIYQNVINAGVDILLYPTDSIEAFNSVKKSVKEGKISEERINSSVRKILFYKYKYIKDNYDNYLDVSNLNSEENINTINKVYS
jgi:beta-N-acetylhexosaminidase